MARDNCMIEFGNYAHADDIAKAAGLIFNPKSDVCISRTKGDKLAGGVIFKDYTGVSIGLHVAAFDPYWLNRDFLWITFDYPFRQLGCKKILSPIPEDNIRSIEFCKKIGFKMDTIIRDVFPTGDMHILSLYKEECRWLNLKPRNIKAGDF